MMYQEDFDKYIDKILEQVDEARKHDYIACVLRYDLTNTLKELYNEVKRKTKDEIYEDFRYYVEEYPELSDILN